MLELKTKKSKKGGGGICASRSQHSKVPNNMLLNDLTTYTEIIEIYIFWLKNFN